MAKIKTLMRIKIKALGEGEPIPETACLDILAADSETEEQEAVRVARETAIRATRGQRGKTQIPQRKRYALYQITPKKLQKARAKRIAQGSSSTGSPLKQGEEGDDDEEEVGEEEEQEEGDGDWDKELAAPDERMQQLMAEYAKVGGDDMGRQWTLDRGLCVLTGLQHLIWKRMMKGTLIFLEMTRRIREGGYWRWVGLGWILGNYKRNAFSMKE